MEVEFSYFRSNVCVSGEMEVEVREGAWMMENLGCLWRSRGLAVEVKVEILKDVVATILLYVMRNGYLTLGKGEK